jgi:hypothetical protein
MKEENGTPSSTGAQADAARMAWSQMTTRRGRRGEEEEGRGAQVSRPRALEEWMSSRAFNCLLCSVFVLMHLLARAHATLAHRLFTRRFHRLCNR